MLSPPPHAALGATLAPPEPRRRRPRRRRRAAGGPRPSRSGADGGDDGDDGGGGRDPWGEGPDDDEGEPWPAGPPRGARELAFGLVLFGIGTLFTIFLGAYLVLRRQSVHWPPDGSPAPPEGLWVSTLLLLACSAVLARAVRAQRSGSARGARRAILGSVGLGAAFLLAQGWLWRGLLAAGLTASRNAYGTVFYTLTGLHALHVLGGLAFLARVLAGGVVLGRESGRTSLELCAVYWHFMGVLWLVLFGALYVTR